jgi:hypothetical protein
VVNLNPKAFQDTPLADLCLEDALKAGFRKSENLKPTDFRETSIRFCINGLRNWLSRYAKDYGDRPFFYTIQDVSWHWASFCKVNSVLVNVCKEYATLSREIVESSSYTDLVERLQQPTWFEKFGHGSRTPCNIVLPLEVLGVIGETGEAIGLPFSKFFQVGLAWSLSMNKQGLYSEWTKDVFTPLFNEIMEAAKKRVTVLHEVRIIFEDRLCTQLREQAEQNGKSQELA